MPSVGYGGRAPIPQAGAGNSGPYIAGGAPGGVTSGGYGGPGGHSSGGYGAASPSGGMFSTGDRTPLLIAIGVIAAILIVVLAIVIRQSGDENTYTDEVRDRFVSSCLDQPNSDEATCECVYGELEAKVAYDDFDAFDRAVESNPDAPRPQWFLDAQAECR
jgi:hypothetical protein